MVTGQPNVKRAGEYELRSVGVGARLFKSDVSCEDGMVFGFYGRVIAG